MRFLYLAAAFSVAALPAWADDTVLGPYPSGMGLVCIGLNACGNATTADRIIAVGRNACATVTTGHDDICIGDNADVPDPTASGLIVIAGQPPRQISQLSEGDFIAMQLGIAHALRGLAPVTK